MLKKKEKSDTTSFLNKKAFTSTKAELEQRMKNLEQQIDQFTTRLKRKNADTKSRGSRQSKQSLWRKAGASRKGSPNMGAVDIVS